jgi:hypothetical protein
MKLHAPKNFVCAECSAVFGLKYDLNRHVAKHHSTIQETAVEPSYIQAETSHSRFADFSVDTHMLVCLRLYSLFFSRFKAVVMGAVFLLATLPV